MNPSVAGYLPILILGIIAALLIFVTLLTSRILGPSNPTERKRTTYESGEITQGSGRGPIAVQYYPYILLFLILDVEILFLVPFAALFGDLKDLPAESNLPVLAISEMVIFVGLLVLGWYYAWKKGVLEWQR